MVIKVRFFQLFFYHSLYHEDERQILPAQVMSYIDLEPCASLQYLSALLGHKRWYLRAEEPNLLIRVAC